MCTQRKGTRSIFHHSNETKRPEIDATRRGVSSLANINYSLNINHLQRKRWRIAATCALVALDCG